MNALLITNVSDSLLWYSELLGCIVPLVKSEYNGEYLSREPAGYTNIVKVCDAVKVTINSNQNYFKELETK